MEVKMLLLRALVLPTQLYDGHAGASRSCASMRVCTITESLDPTTEGRVKFSLAGSGTKKGAPVSHLAGEAAPKPFSSTPPSL